MTSWTTSWSYSRLSSSPMFLMASFWALTASMICCCLSIFCDCCELVLDLKYQSFIRSSSEDKSFQMISGTLIKIVLTILPDRKKFDWLKIVYLLQFLMEAHQLFGRYSLWLGFCGGVGEGKANQDQNRQTWKNEKIDWNSKERLENQFCLKAGVLI